MENIELTRENGHAMAAAMLNAIGDEKLDEAEIWLDRLRELNKLTEEHTDILTFRTLIAIQRGKVADALIHLNSLPENAAPEMKVFCMLFSRDPAWETLANDLADNSPNPQIRQSMSTLLDREGRFN